jgi:cyclopropane fatty-acyl-phospholipid synthase-like methyltransferase
LNQGRIEHGHTPPWVWSHEQCARVIFTMAVLLHIHPSSAALFREIVRVARTHMCTIEAESAPAGYVFPGNYRRVFGRLGCSEVRATQLTRSSHHEVGADYLATSRDWREYLADWPPTAAEPDGAYHQQPVTLTDAVVDERLAY